MFGLSFGINHSKGHSSTDVDRTEDSTQSTTGTQTTTGTTNTAGNTSTNSTQSGTSSTVNTGATTQATTGNQASTGTTQSLSDSVIGGLESAVGNLLGAIPTGPQTMGGSFDHNAYVQQGMEAASNRANQDLDASLNSIYDQFGGRDDSNSMTALLANRARNDTGASLAGVRAQLEQSAQGIDRDRFLANLQGQGSQNNFLNTVLGNLRGGRTTTAGNVATSENVAGTSVNTGLGSTTQTGSENTTSNQTTTQQLQEIINQLVNGTNHVTGTEDTHTSGTTIGGGASASF